MEKIPESRQPPFKAGEKEWIAIEQVGDEDRIGKWVLAVEHNIPSPAPVHLVWMANSVE
jgi:hypothetical protein